MQTANFQESKQTTARAIVQHNKKTNLYRLLVTFNLSVEKITSRSADLISSDFNDTNEIEYQLLRACEILRTNNIRVENVA